MKYIFFSMDYLFTINEAHCIAPFRYFVSTLGREMRNSIQKHRKINKSIKSIILVLSGGVTWRKNSSCRQSAQTSLICVGRTSLDRSAAFIKSRNHLRLKWKYHLFYYRENTFHLILEFYRNDTDDKRYDSYIKYDYILLLA